MKLLLEEIARMAGARAARRKNLPLAEGYSIDSRTIRPGEVFFAVRGTRDGHEFVAAALEAGAAAAVAARGPLRWQERLLLAPDPRAALQRLAQQARERWGGRVVAVTGSNGKTTTKDAAAALAAARFRVAKTEGNLNNDLGLPLTLLRMDEAAQVAVVELGMNHPGEIRRLAEIARPDVGVVTNVSAAHLEFFASVEEIALAKRELVESLGPEGVAVLNADDERVRAFRGAHRGRTVTFGVESDADVRAVEVEPRGLEGTRFRLAGVEGQFTTPLPGLHNLYNTLAALAAAQALGIEPGSLAQAVAGLRPAPMRGEVIEARGARIVNDCYNSNPRAAEAMLGLLRETPARRRIAVLGEMLELGPAAEELHRQVGRKAAEAGVDLLIGVRGAAWFLVDEAARAGVAAHQFFEEPAEAGEFLRRAIEPGDAVLLKGSRGVRLERALEALLADP